jgi:hypothetical protein
MEERHGAMRRLFRWFFRLVLLVILLATVLVLFRNPIVRELAERQIREETGMETVIGRVRIAVKSGAIRVDNVRLINPPEFGGQLFADLPDVYIEYDPIALMFRRIRFQRILFRLDELRVVRDGQGRTNLEAFLHRLDRTGWNERLTRHGLACQGVDMVGFSVGRFSYFDARDPQRHEETFIGVRGISVSKPGSIQEVLDEMGSLARQRGAPQTAQALLGRPPLGIGF